MGSKGKFIHLNILQVDSPSHFWAVEAPGPDMSPEAEAFKGLQDDMNKFYTENISYNMLKNAPQEGMVCVAQRTADQQWYRVKIEKHIRMMKGPHVTCRFLDYGHSEDIPQAKLRMALPAFLELPYQAKLYALHGVKPLTYVTSREDMTTTLKECVEWDMAATKFVETIIKEALDIRCMLMGKDPSGKELIRVYMDHQDKLECLNDLLIDQQYAVDYQGRKVEGAVHNGIMSGAEGSDVDGIETHIRRGHTSPLGQQVAHQSLPQGTLRGSSQEPCMLSEHSARSSLFGTSREQSDNESVSSEKQETCEDEGKTLLEMLRSSTERVLNSTQRSHDSSIAGISVLQQPASRRIPHSTTGKPPFFKPGGRGAAMLQVQKGISRNVGAESCEHLSNGQAQSSLDETILHNDLVSSEPKVASQQNTSIKLDQMPAQRNSPSRNLPNLKPGGRGAALVGLKDPVPGRTTAQPAKVSLQSAQSDQSDPEDQKKETDRTRGVLTVVGTECVESNKSPMCVSEKPLIPTQTGSNICFKPGGRGAALLRVTRGISPEGRKPGHSSPSLRQMDHQKFENTESIRSDVLINGIGSDTEVPDMNRPDCAPPRASPAGQPPVSHIQHGLSAHIDHVSNLPKGPSDDFQHRTSGHSPHVRSPTSMTSIRGPHSHQPHGLSSHSPHGPMSPTYQSVGRGLGGHAVMGASGHMLHDPRPSLGVGHRDVPHHHSAFTPVGHNPHTVHPISSVRHTGSPPGHVPHPRLAASPGQDARPSSHGISQPHFQPSVCQSKPDCTFSPPPGPVRFTIGWSTPKKTEEKEEEGYSSAGLTSKQITDGGVSQKRMTPVGRGSLLAAGLLNIVPGIGQSPKPDVIKDQGQLSSPEPSRTTPISLGRLSGASVPHHSDVIKSDPSQSAPNLGEKTVGAASDQQVMLPVTSPSPVISQVSCEKMSSSSAVEVGQISISSLSGELPPVPAKKTSPSSLESSKTISKHPGTGDAVTQGGSSHTLAPKGRGAALMKYIQMPSVSSDRELSVSSQHQRSQLVSPSEIAHRESSRPTTDINIEQFSDAEPQQQTAVAPVARTMSARLSGGKDFSPPHKVDMILSGTDSGSEKESRLLVGKIKGRLPKHVQSILGQSPPLASGDSTVRGAAQTVKSAVSNDTASVSVQSQSASSGTRELSREHQKLLAQYDRKQQDLIKTGELLKAGGALTSSQESDGACGESPIPSKGVRFSDVNEILSPESARQGSPARPILKKQASNDSAKTTDEESEFQRLDLKGFTAIRRLAELIGTKDRRDNARLKGDLGALEPYLQEPSLEICDPLEVGLLIEGKKLPLPIRNIRDTNLNEDFKETLIDIGVTTPSHMQSYAWPVIQRGLSVVGIAPLGAERSDAIMGDRCVTYLLPLLSNMMLSGTYTNLPNASGPVSLVLCSSWRRAQWVYDRCQQFVIGMKIIKPLVLFGCDESQDISLINGCDILMATPASLLRALKRDVIHLNRLCHLVLDDGDVLVEDFRHLVRDIMSIYAHELKLRSLTEADSVPRQIILMGSQWTKGMQEFRKYMADSVLIINSKTEAAIYSGIKWEVHVWHQWERLDRLVQHLDHVTLPQAKVVIFTSSFTEVHSIHRALTSYCHHVLVAHERMPPNEILDVKKLWKQDHAADSQPILILTDEVMSDIAVDDAVWLIHYSLPETKAVFDDRLWYASKHLKKKDVECTSVVIVTDVSARQAPTILRLLSQANQPIPPKLQEYAMGSLEGREEGKSLPLCSVMKAFGFCRNASRKCKDRHVITKELDMPGKSKDFVKLPTRGEVTVLVMHVMDAGHFFVRLLEVRDQEQVRDMRLDYQRLVLRLNSQLSQPDNRKDCFCPTEGDLYALEDTQHTWHRVMVLEVGKDEDSQKVKVEYVDRGDTGVVAISSLKSLPAEFVDIPFQAVEMFICQVKPLDEDLEWTQRANKLVAGKIHNKELDGKVVLCLGNTLWLHPMRQKIVFPEIKSVSYDNALHSELLQKQLAVKNDKHMTLLYAACQGKIELPEILAVDEIPDIGYNMYGMPTSYRTESLPADRTEITARVCTVDHPGLFFMHRADADKRLNELHQEVRDYLKISSRSNDQKYDLRVGSLVLARLPSGEEDGYVEWFRGKVLDIEDDKYDVFYFDYGDRELVGPQNVQPLSVTLLQNPLLQAIECCLAFVDPIGDEWTVEDGDLLLSMVHDVEERSVPLATKVISTMGSEFAGSKKYCVQLHDKSNGFPIDLGQELVIKGIARPNKQLVQEQFTVKEDDQDEVSEDVKKVTKLCATILLGKGHEEETNAVLELTEIISHLLRVADCPADNIRVAVLLHLMTCLIGYMTESSMIQRLSHIIISCTKHLLEDISGTIDVDVIIVFLRLLLRSTDSESLDLITYALSSFASYPVLRPELLCHQGLYNLGKTLEKTSSSKSQLFIVNALALLIKDALSQPSLISKSGCIAALCNTLKQSDDVQVQLGVIEVFSDLATYERWNEQIRKDGGVVTLCEKVQVVKDQKVQEEMLTLLKTLAESCVFTREAMIDQGQRENFQRLLEGCLSDVARDCCQRMVDLLVNEEGTAECHEEFQPMSAGMQVAAQLFAVRDERGCIRVPSTNKISNRPLPKMSKDIILERRRPEILWIQDKWNIVLRVRVSGVTDQSPSAVTENSVVFRAVVEMIEYWFDFKLYEVVLPSRCMTQINDSEVLIGLRKKSIGRWPRLLQPKGKVSYLRVDFESMIDSDSESDSECQVKSGDDVVGSPLGILGKHKRKTTLPSPPEGYVGKYVGVPESIGPAVSSGESNSSEEDDEVEMDERRFEYFHA